MHGPRSHRNLFSLQDIKLSGRQCKACSSGMFPSTTLHCTTKQGAKGIQTVFELHSSVQCSVLHKFACKKNATKPCSVSPRPRCNLGQSFLVKRGLRVTQGARLQRSLGKTVARRSSGRRRLPRLYRILLANKFVQTLHNELCISNPLLFFPEAPCTAQGCSVVLGDRVRLGRILPCKLRSSIAQPSVKRKPLRNQFCLEKTPHGGGRGPPLTTVFSRIRKLCTASLSWSYTANLECVCLATDLCFPWELSFCNLCCLTKFKRFFSCDRSFVFPASQFLTTDEKNVCVFLIVGPRSSGEPQRAYIVDPTDVRPNSSLPR